MKSKAAEWCSFSVSRRLANLAGALSPAHNLPPLQVASGAMFAIISHSAREFPARGFTWQSVLRVGSSGCACIGRARAVEQERERERNDRLAGKTDTAVTWITLCLAAFSPPTRVRREPATVRALFCRFALQLTGKHLLENTLARPAEWHLFFLAGFCSWQFRYNRARESLNSGQKRSCSV